MSAQPGRRMRGVVGGLAVAVGLLGPPASAFARGQEAARADTIAVFIDCPSWVCDGEYFRTELSFVNHVRDRMEADVQILVTTQTTGSGGTEYTLRFIGLRRLEGRKWETTYSAISAESTDTTRKALVRTMGLALTPYLADKPVFRELKVVSDRKPGAATATKKDPWNFWVIRTSLSGYQYGEKSQSNGYYSGSITANRITAAWKSTSGLTGSWSRSRYDLGDGTSYENNSRNWTARTQLVKSLGPHWSAGGRLVAAASTYTNQNLAVRLAPAVEYNVFPYADSTKRQFTFNYAAGLTRVNYEEETIFDKTSDSLFNETLSATFIMKQPWGNTNTSIGLSHYLNDVTKNSASLYHSMDLKLLKGFSLNVSGSISRIHDQLYLPKRGATDEEILVRRRQLATSYDYYLSFGFSYTFGSIYNNVVNSRFGSDGGGSISYSY